MTTESEKTGANFDRAEQSRVDAESGRVIAEGERVVNEGDEETGRVTAEQGRVSAESGRVLSHDSAMAAAARAQSQFDDELDALRSDPSHYMTPGARSYFRRVVIGYIILAIAGTIGVWAVSNRVDEQIRNDINDLGKTSCMSSINSLTSYNDLVEAQIVATREARDINLERGDIERAEANTDAIIRLQGLKLDVPTEEQCQHTEILPD